jgi:uncharacterized protein (TIGR03435 family)
MTPAITRRDATRLCIAAICSTAFPTHPAAFAQSAPPAQPAAPPQFDVATIRPYTGDSAFSSGIETRHGRLNAQNVTLKRCIIGAYGVGPHQVFGDPDWIDAEPFDIQAKSEQLIEDDAVMNQMLQALLADRFKLALHSETRTTQAYVLEVDKKGPKLDKAGGGDSSTSTSTGKAGRVTIQALNTDMDLFAKILSRKVDLPVVNQTGVNGIFDFTIHWTPDTIRPSDQTADDVSIFAALPEQLGLHLRATKAPVEMLIIDHVEKPSDN